MKRVVFCWPQYSGYMAACWRRLAAAEGVDLLVLAFSPGGGGGADAPFEAGVMAGIPHRELDAAERRDPKLIARLVREHEPETVVLSGWFHKPYRDLIDEPALRGCRFVMGMDNPWLGLPRQHLGRLGYRRFRARMDAVVVPGERSFQFARRLGFPSSRIHRGLYAVEEDALSGLHAVREGRPGGWPRAFLFAGRYAPEKGLDTLIEGYRRYRAAAESPWDLRCCGTGPLGGLLRGEPGVTDFGFTQPRDMPGRLLEAGCFVLASRYDPWPLVVVEACMAGLPVVCSDACGSAVELLRPHHNGFFFGTDDPASLAEQLGRIDQASEELPHFGRNSLTLASAYGPAQWLSRWLALIDGPSG